MSVRFAAGHLDVAADNELGWRKINAPKKRLYIDLYCDVPQQMILPTRGIYLFHCLHSVKLQFGWVERRTDRCHEARVESSIG